jgi:hypothetical protein
VVKYEFSTTTTWLQAASSTGNGAFTEKYSWYTTSTREFVWLIKFVHYLNLPDFFSSGAKVSKVGADAKEEIRREKKRRICRYGETGLFMQVDYSS